MIPPEAQRKTEFSPCRKWRYTLWRSWAIEDLTGFECSSETRAHEFVQFIGLNPSTADETKDDPTIRRCIGYAKDWGFGAMCMTNLFAFRATDPEVMKAQKFPIDEYSSDESKFIRSNFDYIGQVAFKAGLVVAAWGTHGSHLNHGKQMIAYFKGLGIKLHHLGLNSDGSPKHPLYLRKDLKPTPF